MSSMHSSGMSSTDSIQSGHSASSSRFSGHEKFALKVGICAAAGAVATPFIYTNAATIASGFSMAAAAGGGIALGTISGGGVALGAGVWNSVTSMSNRYNSQFKGANRFLDMIKVNEKGEFQPIAEQDDEILKTPIYNKYGFCLKGIGRENMGSLLAKVNATEDYKTPAQALKGVLEKDMRFSQRRKQISSILMYTAAGALLGAGLGSLGLGFGAIPVAVVGGLAGLAVGIFSAAVANRKLKQELDVIDRKIEELFSEHVDEAPRKPTLPNVRAETAVTAPDESTTHEPVPLPPVRFAPSETGHAISSQPAGPEVMVQQPTPGATQASFGHSDAVGHEEGPRDAGYLDPSMMSVQQDSQGRPFRDDAMLNRYWPGFQDSDGSDSMHPSRTVSPVGTNFYTPPSSRAQLRAGFARPVALDTVAAGPDQVNPERPNTHPPRSEVGSISQMSKTETHQPIAGSSPDQRPSASEIFQNAAMNLRRSHSN